MHVWLALDLEDEVTGKPRLAMQDRPFEPGWASPMQRLQGHSWEIREGELDEATWADLLAARLTPDQQDALHRELWTSIGPTPWPGD